MRRNIGARALSLVLLLSCAAGCVSLRCTPQTVPGRTAPGQTREVFEKRIQMTMKMGYLLYLPDGYAESQEKWPLILFLHGAGERGDDLAKVEKHGPPKLIAEQGKKFPFVIVSPQCPDGEWWASDVQVAALDALLTDIQSRYRIDSDRIYLTGLSMGGFGTWRLATEYPDRFAAIVPICGGGISAEQANKIARLPIWVFHGAKDQTVPIKNSQDIVDALKKAGSDVKFTVYPDAGHDAWTETYDNPELYDWFLQHRRSPGTSAR